MLLGSDIKKEFPLLQEYPDMVYVDNASTTQKPLSVISAMDDYQKKSYSNIHRGMYDIAQQSESLYHESKKKVASFIGGDYREVIYTYNATYASNIIAQSLVSTYSLSQGDVVLIGLWDHHATIVPRQILSEQYGFEIQFISIDQTTLDIDWDEYKYLVSSYKPKVVVCSHISNVTGIVYDIKQMSEILLSESSSSLLVVDGSQAVPHMKVNVQELGCDVYFFTGHKLMGPTGIGVLWMKKLLSRSLKTTFGGGGIIESVTTDGCSLIRTADKFEPGTPNLIGAIGLSAAIDFYNNHNIYEYIGDHENMLFDVLKKGLSGLSQITIVGGDSLQSRCGIFSFSAIDSLLLAEYLADHHICVRVGGHCAHPLLHHLHYDQGVIRISPFVYNTIDDMQRIVDCIRQFYH